MTIEGTVGSRRCKFIFDTGIGVTVVSKRLADALGLEDSGTFQGKRMSGQDILVDLVTIPTVDVSGIRREKVTAGIFDILGSPSLPEEFKEVDGILSPSFFEDFVFTVDYDSKEISLGNDSGHLDMEGTLCKIEAERTGPSLSLFIRAILPSGKRVRLEVDSGSSSLILNKALMNELNIQANENESNITRGTDETGHEFTRYNSHLKGDIQIDCEGGITYKQPEVVFQDIIYDGLIGNEFLKQHKVTFDISNSRILFS